MNILVLAAGDPMAGGGGDAYPIWLSEIDGCLVLERQVKALLSLGDGQVIFAFRGAEIDAYHVDEIARQIVPTASVVDVRRPTAGAACTALLAIGKLDLNAPLIVVSATDHIDVDYPAVIAGFEARGADAGILTFDSLHPRYSFVRIDPDGLVVEAAEKRPISRKANAGFYWFARAGDFIDGIKQMILKDAHVNGTFYISPSLNELILKNKRIATWHIEGHRYHPLKDQRQFETFDQQIDGRKRHAS